MEPVTPNETHLWLRDYFRQRPDIGFWKAVLNTALYPPNPFKPEARRLPRHGFLFAAGLLTFAISWIVYFNFVR
jgi:hypothetical protein